MFKKTLFGFCTSLTLINPSWSYSTSIPYDQILDKYEIKTVVQQLPKSEAWFGNVYEVTHNSVGQSTVKLGACTTPKHIFLYSYERVNWVIDNPQKCPISAVFVGSYKSAVGKYAINVTLADSVPVYWYGSMSYVDSLNHSDMAKFQLFVEDTLNVPVVGFGKTYYGSMGLSLPAQSINSIKVPLAQAISPTELGAKKNEFLGSEAWYANVQNTDSYYGKIRALIPLDSKNCNNIPKVLFLSAADTLRWWIGYNTNKCPLKAVVFSGQNSDQKMSDIKAILPSGTPFYRISGLDHPSSKDDSSFVKIRQWIEKDLGIPLVGMSFESKADYLYNFPDTLWQSNVANLSLPHQVPGQTRILSATGTLLWQGQVKAGDLAHMMSGYAPGVYFVEGHLGTQRVINP